MRKPFTKEELANLPNCYEEELIRTVCGEIKARFKVELGGDAEQAVNNLAETYTNYLLRADTIESRINSLYAPRKEQKKHIRSQDTRQDVTDAADCLESRVGKNRGSMIARELYKEIDVMLERELDVQGQKRG